LGVDGVKEAASEWYTKLRRGRVIVGATITGNINVIDPRVSLNPQNKIEGAHTGAVEDIDTQDNTLITCGWTYRSPPETPLSKKKGISHVGY
jgi:hypothetical protein